MKLLEYMMIQKKKNQRNKFKILFKILNQLLKRLKNVKELAMIRKDQVKNG